MWNWIKELGKTVWAILALIGAIVFGIWLIMSLLFPCSACAQEIEEFYIPVQVSLDSEEVVLVPSYDPDRFDLDNYIDISNETGLYPNFGWTGEYYVTGVTHGSVGTWAPATNAWKENLMLGVSKSDVNLVYSGEEPDIPEPSTLTLLGLGALVLLRRSR